MEWVNSHGIPWFSDSIAATHGSQIVNHVGFILETHFVGVMKLRFPFRWAIWTLPSSSLAIDVKNAVAHFYTLSGFLEIGLVGIKLANPFPQEGNPGWIDPRLNKRLQFYRCRERVSGKLLHFLNMWESDLCLFPLFNRLRIPTSGLGPGSAGHHKVRPGCICPYLHIFAHVVSVGPRRPRDPSDGWRLHTTCPILGAMSAWPKPNCSIFIHAHGF